MMAKIKQLIKIIFQKFGWEIRKIKFEHDISGIKEKEIPKNDKIIKTKDPEWLKFKKECQNFTIDDNYLKNPFIFSKSINFELSNLCNYARIHFKCPLNLEREPNILPAKIVYNALDSLKKYNFQGQIAFHNYNEPLIDPRLFKFIEYSRRLFLQNEIYICTNGFYFTQSLGEELAEAGVSTIHISVYSEREFNRLSKIHLKIPLKLTPMKLLDCVLSIYNSQEKKEKRPCLAPLNEIIITNNGELGLCCVDWKKNYTFGSLKEEPLEKIMAKKEVYCLYQRIRRGDRFLSLCKKCNQSR